MTASFSWLHLSHPIVPTLRQNVLPHEGAMRGAQKGVREDSALAALEVDDSPHPNVHNVVAFVDRWVRFLSTFH